MSDTVGLVLSVLKGATPLPRRGSDVCPVLVVYINIVLGIYFGHMFLDVGISLRLVFASFSIVWASLVRASILHRMDLSLIVDIF